MICEHLIQRPIGAGLTNSTECVECGYVTENLTLRTGELLVSTPSGNKHIQPPLFTEEAHD